MVITIYQPAVSVWQHWQNEIQKQNYKNTLLSARYIDKLHISYGHCTFLCTIAHDLVGMGSLLVSPFSYLWI